MTDSDPKEIVRQGYDAVSRRYRNDHAYDEKYVPWLAALRKQLPPDSAVLDVGCGCGVPVARSLTEHGHRVTGVDFSEVQIQRARELAPAATFLQADATQLAYPPASFDAIVCLYTLIHIPLEEQPSLLGRIAGWLRPGGWLLATTGHQALTEMEENWLDGSAPMWWSQADAATYRTWITAAGLAVTSEAFVPEGSGGHQLFWAHRSLEAAGGHCADSGHWRDVAWLIGATSVNERSVAQT